MSLKFVFIGPYITTPEAKEIRARLHKVHAARAQQLKAEGVIKFGGPMWNDQGEGEGIADRAYGGTFFVMEAESYAAALEIIKADEYYKGGLWDIPNIVLEEYNSL